MPEYIAAFRADPEKDAVQHGVKGMRWGVRRSDSQLRAAAKSRGSAPAKKDSTEKKPAASSSGTVKEKPQGDIQSRVESSSDRYDRITGTVKNGRASDLTEADLKFYNARTDALAKINKMNEQQPSWLRETATKVIQQSAQRQMQGLADAVADKYIGDPIKQALKGAADTAAVAKTVKAEETAKPKTSIKDAASKIADKVEAKAKTETATKTDTKTETTTSSSADPSKMRMADAIRYYKDNPDVNPTPPEGYSENAKKIFYDEVKKARGK